MQQSAARPFETLVIFTAMLLALYLFLTQAVAVKPSKYYY
jgi:hypothetical protein